MKMRMCMGIVCLGTVAGALLFSGGEMAVWAQAKPESSLPRTNVTVMASAVRLTRETYCQLGGSLIVEDDFESVVQNIIAHVNDHPESVLAGCRVHPANHETGECVESQTVTIRRQGKRKSVEFDGYECGKSFNVIAGVMDYRRIQIEYAWEVSWFEAEIKNRTSPPPMRSWSWSGTTNMVPGKPQIAGSHLDGEHMVLLVLMAQIDE